MPGRGDLQIYRDSAALAHALADLFVSVGRMAMAERGAFYVALSGGETPRAAYELLAGDEFRNELSWSDVFIYFGDERCVPPDDDQSNYRMAKQAFIDAVGIPHANVHRIHGEIEPGHAANQYASLLRTELGNAPSFDLVLLGLGKDGHTASLFPGTPPDTDDEAFVRAVYAPTQMMWRITFTPKVINLGRTVAFEVAGSAKAEILAAVYDGPINPVKYPAQSVHPLSGRLIWLVDELAAEMLKSEGR
ncbi:MAG: 6-phosphogluconolactonase [Candidatus Eremiobacteraeota bacterium]|nr:6-phosphogluconolactonase [Candidatus Eremiobacteraeota bacterium]